MAQDHPLLDSGEAVEVHAHAVDSSGLGGSSSEILGVFHLFIIRVSVNCSTWLSYIYILSFLLSV